MTTLNFKTSPETPILAPQRSESRRKCPHLARMACQPENRNIKQKKKKKKENPPNPKEKIKKKEEIKRTQKQGQIEEEKSMESI